MARSAAHYHGPLAEAIKRFKYQAQLVLADPLGKIMADALASGPAADLDPATADVICPVPLHELRLRERGFNQSELLAESVAAMLGKPLRPLLERTRPTAPQVDIPAESRAANVRDAFAARPTEVTAGRRVLLVDDLYTTGATLTECARALNRAEAAEVRVFTLARALPRWRVGARPLPSSQ
jgi:ComF family protein